jgi:Na+-transporting NADH:ubiquinone oxidoreductase subunit NqrB
MQALRKLLDRIGQALPPGWQARALYPLYEAADTFFYSPGSVTKGGATCATRWTSSA